MDSKKIKEEIIKAGEMAVHQLIKVAKEEIIKPDPEDELAADRLKNAAATKKLAIFDAFEIMKRIEEEREKLDSPEQKEEKKSSGGFAERRSRK
jgi:hypothetical protein